MHYAEEDVIISNPTVLVKLINALIKAPEKTNSDSLRMQCLGEGIRVWTKKTIEEALEPISADEGVELKRVSCRKMPFIVASTGEAQEACRLGYYWLQRLFREMACSRHANLLVGIKGNSWLYWAISFCRLWSY